MFKKIALITLLIFTSKTYSQGCSDAGMCSVGSMRSGEIDTSKFKFTLSYQYGVGEQNVNIHNTSFEISGRINQRSSIQFKLPFISTHGNLGNISALGDPTLVYTRQMNEHGKVKLNTNLGLKFPLGSTRAGSVSMTSLSSTFAPNLPMPYQTGLGTFDLLLGADIKYKSYVFALGFQLPLIQNNGNSFDTSYVTEASPAKKYFSSSKLIRKPDLVARFDKGFVLNSKFRLQAGFVGIYHLAADQTVINGQTKEIENSDGLTLNFSSGLEYNASKYLAVKLNFATPLMVRKVRPDGLTRHYVIGIDLKYTFY
ncbi:MAG TPA: hypothetical protein VGF79_09170 [Bacteroidia bacterium]